MKYRKRVEKPQGPISPPLIFWGGAGKAYALLIAAGLLGASPAGARSYGSGPRVEGGRVVVTDDGFSRDDARDNGLADRFEVAREDAPREMTAAEAVAFCRSYAERRDDAGRWRVPTQRELMQAVIVRVRLTGLEPFDSEVYWSSSAVPRQFGEEERYGVHMRTGSTLWLPLRKTARVRCVRTLGENEVPQEAADRDARSYRGVRY